jgi:hypothetical protein
MAQVGGESTFQFLTLNQSARTSALAGSSIAINDIDINLINSNPALLDSNLHQHIAINYTNYIADINYGMVNYAYHHKLGTFAASINYFNYGDFTEADETGSKLGEFSASDYAFNLSYAHPLYKNFQWGINLKFLYSDYFQYSSSGLALDGGIAYKSKDKNTGFALVFKNLGQQIKPYREGNYESLPFDLQIGLAQKLKHAPFRFTLALHHLHYWEMAYDSPLDENTSVIGEETPKKSGFESITDEAIRHLNVGVEIVPGKNFYLRAGYNFQRLKEMAIKDKFGMVGFSFGAGIRIYKFHISYSRAIYHVAGASNTFSISSNLNEFIK